MKQFVVRFICVFVFFSYWNVDIIQVVIIFYR